MVSEAFLVRQPLDSYAMKTVGSIAAGLPGAARVLEESGIEYCCAGGTSSLADACSKAGVPVEELMRRIDRAAVSRSSKRCVRNWSKKSISEITAYIVERHHSFARRELSRLVQLAAKVAWAHGEDNPGLYRAHSVLADLKQNLGRHMLKEEQVLFPFFHRMEQAIEAGEPLPPSFFANIEAPIGIMNIEHENSDRALAEIRESCGNLDRRPQPCAGIATLYSGLREFERDLRIHLDLENNVLFPRAIRLQGLRASVA